MHLALYILLYIMHPNIEPGLEKAYEKTVAMWAPNVAYVSEVRWANGYDMLQMGQLNAYFGMYQDRSIIVNPTLNNGQWDDFDLTITLAHEYGHALGMQHVEGYAIMYPLWNLPIPDKPTNLDWDELDRVKKLSLDTPLIK